jgi:hypothetical protein
MHVPGLLDLLSLPTGIQRHKGLKYSNHLPGDVNSFFIFEAQFKSYSNPVWLQISSLKQGILIIAR